MTTLGDTLDTAMRRAGVGAKTLSKLTGIPRTAIDNWRDGTVRRPRDWRPLLHIARVLSLSSDETEALLSSTGYPPVAGLAAAAGDADRALLASWLAAGGTPGEPDNRPRPPQLRAATADFTGRRDELARASAALSGGGSGVVGVRGMAGVGKTEFALAAVERVRERYPDGQVMVGLHGLDERPLTPDRALRQVIRALQREEAEGVDDVEELQRRYCAALSGRRVLVLADDAASAAQLRPLLPPAGCALLVTSRRRFALPGMSAIDLSPFSEAEAVALLGAVCARLTGPSARSIARACGYLPLALRITGGVLANDPALAVGDHLAALTGGGRLAQLRDPDDGDLDVTATLNPSCEYLEEPVRDVLQQLGVLAGDFTAELAAAVVAPGADAAGALRILLRRNLVEFDPVRRRYRLHDLVRDLALEWLDRCGHRPETERRYALAVADRLTGEDQAHTAAAVQWARAHPDDPDAARVLASASGHGLLDA